jgi:hypothetical protein
VQLDRELSQIDVFQPYGLGGDGKSLLFEVIIESLEFSLELADVG